MALHSERRKGLASKNCSNKPHFSLPLWVLYSHAYNTVADPPASLFWNRCLILGQTLSPGTTIHITPDGLQHTSIQQISNWNNMKQPTDRPSAFILPCSRFHLGCIAYFLLLPDIFLILIIIKLLNPFVAAGFKEGSVGLKHS